MNLVLIGETIFFGEQTNAQQQRTFMILSYIVCAYNHINISIKKEVYDKETNR